EEDLLQLVCIAEDRGQVLGKCQFCFYLRGLELVIEQRECLANDDVQIGFAELRAAGAREVEQIVDDLGGAEGLRRDFFEQWREAFVAAQLFGEHLRIGRDDGERGIDFVRDSGGEQTDGGEFFCLAELCFEFGALGDVVEKDDASNSLKIARYERCNGDV